MDLQTYENEEELRELLRFFLGFEFAAKDDPLYLACLYASVDGVACRVRIEPVTKGQANKLLRFDRKNWVLVRIERMLSGRESGNIYPVISIW